MVQVAVPSELLDSPALTEFLLESLEIASELGSEFFRRKGLDFPLADAKHLVQRIRKRVDSKLARSGRGFANKNGGGRKPKL